LSNFAGHKTEPPFHPPADSAKPSHPMVDCCLFE
jgi:hypothetical protein